MASPPFLFCLWGAWVETGGVWRVIEPVGREDWSDVMGVAINVSLKVFRGGGGECVDVSWRVLKFAVDWFSFVLVFMYSVVLLGGGNGWYRI